MRTVRMFVSDDRSDLGFHKRRAALGKIIKVIKKLTPIKTAIKRIMQRVLTKGDFRKKYVI